MKSTNKLPAGSTGPNCTGTPDTRATRNPAGGISATEWAINVGGSLIGVLGILLLWWVAFSLEDSVLAGAASLSTILTIAIVHLAVRRLHD